jgi:DNA-binding MarR family transcriptional regulator
MKLADILGYRLDIVHRAAVRSFLRRLEGSPFRATDIIVLLLLRDQPGCDQTAIGRALDGNRSVGMKTASRLEAEGLVTRGAGRDRRCKATHLTPAGETALDDVLRRLDSAEAALAAYLTTQERVQLLTLLGKVERGLLEEESALQASPQSRDRPETQKPAHQSSESQGESSC